MSQSRTLISMPAVVQLLLAVALHADPTAAAAPTHDFGSVEVGSNRVTPDGFFAPFGFCRTNGFPTFEFLRMSIEGCDSQEPCPFTISTDCTGVLLDEDPLECCFPGVTFSPTSTGYRQAILTYDLFIGEPYNFVDTSQYPVQGIGVDTTPPGTIITSGPSGMVRTRAVSFEWEGRDLATLSERLAYGFRLDPVEAVFTIGATTTASYAGLDDGDYTFILFAIDESGNEGVVTTRSFTVQGPPASSGSSPATVSEVVGTVEVRLQGVSTPVTPGSALVSGMELTIGPSGEVAGACDDGRSFRFGANTRLFLEGPLCPTLSTNPVSSRFVDVTQGQLVFTALNGQAVMPTIRTPISRSEIGAAGADFSTTYSVGRATTTVHAGSVTVTNVVTGATQAALTGATVITELPGNVPPLGTVIPNVVAAILPGSRSMQVGSTATVFATMLNAGIAPALVCQISLATPVPVTFSYQTTNAANQTVGTGTTPISISGGGLQSFVLSFTPTQPFAPTQVQLRFSCGGASDGAGSAPMQPGVNSLLLSASADPTPDVIALASTSGGQGIVSVADASAFAVAAVNVGVSARVTASVDTGSALLPIVVTLCQTDPATAACTNPGTPAGLATLHIGANETATFSVFARATGPIAFDPGTNRLNFRLKTEQGIVVGLTSVAVEAGP